MKLLQEKRHAVRELKNLIILKKKTKPKLKVICIWLDNECKFIKKKLKDD